ncbi:erythrocyte membrane protein 1, PfEMP1, putative [Plasmodium sp.]|nr:erythrocyte membrane protein 1, PfEMP1, putative [Plasmodium sp.]
MVPSGHSPPSRATASGPAPVPASEPNNRIARDILEGFGAIIQQQAKNNAEQHGSELKGVLSKATYPKDKIPTNTTPSDPCEFIHAYHTNVTDGFGKHNPCKNRPNVRFSDVIGGQCTDGKISGNNTSTGGACAPLRRLFLCDQHLSHMNERKIDNTNNLLLEVSLAAKYEGDSIIENYPSGGNNKEGICTALARSFADIGDIVRGKDLFKGYNSRDRKEKAKLQENLKKIFKEIYNKLRNTEARKEYQKDAPNYYKLREDWWTANRETVWKAITCRAGEDDRYSTTKVYGTTDVSHGRCGHGERTVLTDLDYVPQFLRWFDEWGEEFCRKRNIKLKLAKKECRGEGNTKYCSQNGYDCTKPILNKDASFRDPTCTSCSNKCVHYDIWLINQRNEFKKQKTKYNHEIKAYVDGTRISNSNINKEYYKEFYENFGKNDYKRVNDFLTLLNKGTYCKEGLEQKDVIDFTITGDKDAFYRSEYCQPCPDCVVDCKNKRCVVKEKKDGNCGNNVKYKPPENVNPTEITVLYNAYGKGDICNILTDVCTDANDENKKKIEKWECYYKSDEDNYCEMKCPSPKDPKHPKVISFHKFFNLWVQNFLTDTIKWENEFKDCINNTNVTDCDSACNENCKCYKQWVDKKQREWDSVKKVFKNTRGISDNNYSKLNGIFSSFFYEVMHKLKEKKVEEEGEEAEETQEAQEVEGNWYQLTEKLKEIIESSKQNTGTANSQNEIELLFDHLKENSTTCIDNNSLESGEKCKKKEKNPCSKPNDATQPIKSVKQLAEEKQQEAREQLEENVGEIKLKGDASKGKYKQGGPESDFKELCNINQNHSNRNPDQSTGPCGGKGEGIHTRFVVETEWEPDETNMRDGHKDIIIPPRRRHICTSNLEYLQTPDKPLNGTDGIHLVNHSFLGDVLLSAKYEANNIIETYKKKNNLNDPKELTDQKHLETMCRAIRYSFADIGDIIRGRDIWDKETGMNYLQGHLKNVFGNIHKSLKEKRVTKYDEDGPEYIKLREDWWEANRHQVWRAMKCEIEKGKIPCNGIPIEDYIPERLRWMTEWAEWYCKIKSKVNKECDGCWDNGKPGGKECTGGTEVCKKYDDKIKLWKNQLKNLQTQYSTLYANAQIAAFKGGRDRNNFNVEDKDKPVYDFLYDLHVKNGGTVGSLGSTDNENHKPATTKSNTMYYNVGSYLYDAEDFKDCTKKTEFCDSVRRFKLPPLPPLPQPPPEAAAPEGDGKTEEDDKVCKMVKELLEQSKGGIKPINDCNRKDHGKNGYPGWDCTNPSLVTGNGECMPPRRQKLCIYFLAGKKETEKIETQEKLREAFIKSAAAETFFAWYKYKEDKQKESSSTKQDQTVQEVLEGGTIPEDFKRQMFYTFGDYRDLCMDTDISIKKDESKGVGKAKINIDGIFKDSDNIDEHKRKQWWDGIKNDVWLGMLCALEKISGKNNIKSNPDYTYPNVKFSDKTTTLEKFAQRPQFLRWFTEWGEEFCKKRKEQVEILKTACKDYECNEENMDQQKKKCEDACKVYQDWLKDWKTQYEKQSQKFTTDKEKPEYKVDVHVTNSTHAYEYLSKKLKPICQNETNTDKCDYTCMENASKQPQTSDSTEKKDKPSTENNYPEAFDCPPKEIADKCNCPKLPEPKYCVDKTAYDIRKEREKNVANIYSKLKKDVKDFNSQCNKVNKNNVTVKDSCNFEETYKKSLDNINETCKGKGVDRLKIGQKWNSKYITKIGKDIFIPPRREYICLNDLNTLMPSNIHDSSDLLKKIQDVAKIEGDDIIKKLLPQYPCNEDVICKAMKYSFADLGDIIRGRDMLLGINSANAYETTLKGIFEKIRKNFTSKNSDDVNKYSDETTFRSAWWDANREEIWKAMTCNAPYDAKIYITKEGGYISPLTWTKNHCGHKDDPPDYDYIPQPLRWISEWSESYCLAQKDFLESMKNCENCNKNSGDCKQKVHGACMDCKKKCEKYKEFVEIWKKQFETQKKAYEEIYKKATTSNGIYFNGIDENTKHFVKKLKENCKTDDFTTADKYLEGGSVCRRFKFVKTDTHEKNYAFHNTPLSYVDHCECAKKYDPLDECPVDKDECEKYGKYPCQKKKLNKELENWTNKFVKNNKDKNKAVMVPPRRRQLCLIGNRRFVGRVKDEKMFKEYLLRDASSEAKMLSQYYNFDNEKALQAIKYSFADIGNIIKGDDMLDDGISEKIENIFEHKINKRTHSSSLSSSSSSRPKITPSSWWEKNKEQIWNVMMCHYNGEHKTSTKCPPHNDIDNEDQFLRWMTEWAQYFCKEKKKEVSELIDKCKTEITTKTYSTSNQNKQSSCYKELQKYDHWLYNRKLEWSNISKKYQTYYNENSKSKPMKQSAQEYVDEKCNDCKCNFDDIIKQYDKNGNGVSIMDILFKNDEPKKNCGPDTSDKSHTKPPAPLPPPPPPPPLPLPSDEPFNRDILEKTIPFGVALALGSIAFLFLKKKTHAPLDLFSVINIPKGDYDIPTLKSSNRYIPYASDKYKGKTYIYMEGDSSGDEKYAFMSDTTDVTSSESEYEELDINDIYVPSSPKYKTLIEVVLEPSKRDIQNDDIPMNKFTDEEWNQLKHDFISNMLQSQPNDVPNNYTTGNVTLNTQPNTLYFDNNQEKPFITSIHDRNLYSGEEYNYNVNMVNNDNIPINRDNNDVYSGIDLINDSLNNNKVDIYDEVLKRKENELFGTNHTKHTNTHNVTKSSNSDPIDNQLDLFHTWLDRHRDMGEKWNNKEEVLDKLKEEWNKDNNSGDIHTSDSNKTLNTDVSIQIHMDNPKPINEFTNMDTILEDLEKYNEPYYDVQDDIYYDVNDHDTSTVDSNNMDVPSKVQIEMDVNTKLVKEKYPIADVWDI